MRSTDNRRSGDAQTAARGPIGIRRRLDGVASSEQPSHQSVNYGFFGGSKPTSRGSSSGRCNLVLGAALFQRSPRGRQQLDAATANRLLYAIELYRERKAPLVILSGGPPPFAPTLPPQADQMDLVLQTMGVPKIAIVQESSSYNTYESARAVNVILRNRQIHRILLVTSAFHMPRALKVFRTLGINVIAAPCDFFTDAPPHFGTYKHWQSAVIASVPSAEALSETTLALRECLWWITNSL
jgi:uncharacterized SAM-binding protein YcdF (DUF218 family)